MISHNLNEQLKIIEQSRVNHTVWLLSDAKNSGDICPEEQAFNLEVSHITEVLNGESQTDFNFDVRAGRLYAMQPRGVTDWRAMHENGLERAELIAKYDPRYNFYKDIAQAELDEAYEQGVMVQSGQPATMFTLSLCGDDVASSEVLKSLGRDPEAKKAFFRLSVFDGQKLSLTSRSMEGLTVADAHKIYSQFFGIELPEGANSIDIFKTRVSLIGAQPDLLDKILPPVLENTYQFVLAQKDLLEAHMDSLDLLAGCDLPESARADLVNNLRYDIMSSFKQRQEGTWIDLGALSDSVTYAGMTEREAGTEFPGCDTVVTATNKPAKAGYVNAIESFINNAGQHEFESKWCPNCLPKPLPGKKVKAWRRGNEIGCKDCGHIVDVCTKGVVKQGKKQKVKST